MLSSKRQIILLNVNDGFYERKLKYDPRKFPKHEEYIKIYMLSLLISLIFLFWLIILKINIYFIFIFYLMKDIPSINYIPRNKNEKNKIQHNN